MDQKTSSDHRRLSSQGFLGSKAGSTDFTDDTDSKIGSDLKGKQSSLCPFAPLPLCPFAPLPRLGQPVFRAAAASHCWRGRAAALKTRTTKVARPRPSRGGPCSMPGAIFDSPPLAFFNLCESVQSVDLSPFLCHLRHLWLITSKTVLSR